MTPSERSANRPGDFRAWIWVAGAAGALAAAVLLTPAPLWLAYMAILALGWGLPGLLLAWLWELPGVDLPAFLLVAFGLGLGWLIAGALLIHHFPGPIAGWANPAVYGAGAVVLLTIAARRSPRLPALGDAQMWRWGLILLALTALLRLPGLGYHEFHADEAVLLRQAGRAVSGQDDALAEHTKGPGEIAVTLAVYRALGTADETTTRLPFALMSVGSVLATAWLGRRLFSPRAGLWAGVLLATNGFALGLSRIAQYQPAVLLFSALAVWAMWEFAQRGEGRWLALAAAWSAVGLIMHYEFGLLAPALLYLAWRGWARVRDASHGAQRSLAVTAGAAASLAALVVGAAYLPALRHPYLSTTQGYLTNRLGEVGAFNLPFFVEMGTFYNSTYYFAGLALLAAAGTALGLRRQRVQIALLTLWWLPFFVLYIFIIRYPGTHFYLLMESWSLLAALPLAAVTASSARPALRWVAPALIGLWLAVSTHYLYLIFFRQDPEYLVNYDAERVPFYWAPFPVPEKPRFGFPIQEGWKTVGVLGEWGYLQETYGSNDSAWSLRRWYLTAFTKRDFDRNPDFIFVATHVQEANPEFDDDLLDSYTRAGEVRVRGEPRLEIWARTPLPAYVSYDAEQFAAPFRADVASLEPPPDPPARVQDATLGESLRLRSAHLPQTRYAAGDTLHLLLVWEPLQPLSQDYKVFVHVAGPDGRPVAQWDGLPGLNTARTSQWPAGEPFRDHVLLTLPADAPAGEYALLAGMYDGETGARLGDASVEIATVKIR